MIFPWSKKEAGKPDPERTPEMRYERSDSPKSVEKDDVVKKGVFSTSHRWARGVESIAMTLSKSQMSGILSKNVLVLPNEVAVVVRDGRVDDVVDSGKVTVGGLFKTESYMKDVEVVMMDTSPKDSNWQVGELWTSDQHEVAAKGLLRYRIHDPKKFFSMVYAYSTVDKKGERFLSLEDINERIKSEVLTRVLQPETSSVEVEDIYGNRELQHKIENELELQLKQTLDMWGLELQKFTTEWDLGDYTELIRTRRGFEKREETKGLENMEKVGDIEREGNIKEAEIRTTYAPIVAENVIKRKEELEKAKARLEIERLEDEADFRAAQEGLKLKEQMNLVKTKGMRAEREVEQDMLDREHARAIENTKIVLDKGGADAARIIAEGREYGKLSPEQIAAIAKARESEARAKDDKLTFMKEIEDRERSDAHRRQELDAKLMDAAKPIATGSVKKCPHCGATVPMHASFCGECGSKLG